ncbi:MAG: phosphate ABC transporter ATP-binding protein [Firmicutes bacterium]|nr:phosphate ABC transporter ATP-binding protein [Bacillota bacterium]
MAKIPVFRTIELTKEYNGREILKKVNLTVPRGKISSILGPSGAGKSTLLRILNLLEKPTAGKILFDGEDVNQGYSARLKMKRKMTLLLQEPYLFDSDIEHNLSYPLKIRGVSSPEIKEKLESALELVKPNIGLRDKARNLSGGEAQRVALARSLIFNPEVLMLDEPAANLDPTNVALIEEILSSIGKKFGTTILLVTHNVLQAKRLSDFVSILWNGEIIESGTKEEIFNNSKNSLTAAFIKGEIVF